ncbi:MAG: recombination mediator RecR [candidate division Zixibacteria bacterium]|jgi:recombination protein RecR|nr:recombination mediator RecR [candidate division Zixibacteria bacterium]
MFESAGSVERLINRLARLPGIGRKTAARLAFHILKSSKEEAMELAEAIQEVKERVGFCSTCFNISETDPCSLCTDARRQRDVICVVEEAADLSVLMKVEGFNGLFHVLGGRLSPLDGIGPDDLHMQELMARLTGDVKEVIIATNPNVEGEATAAYLSRLIRPLGITVTRIARGLPVGSDLEYADAITLARALEGRQNY